MNRTLALLRVFMTMAVLVAGATHAQGLQMNAEMLRFKRLTGLLTSSRKDIPFPFSQDKQAAATAGEDLLALLEAGEAKVAVILRADSAVIDSVMGKQIPLEKETFLKLCLDPEKGQFVVADKVDRAEGDGGLNDSAWLFYKMFFQSYAALPDFYRSVDSPLARGVAALAALNLNYSSDLALLPRFRGEAAAAILAVNADPGLVKTLRTKSHSECKESLRTALANIPGIGNDAAAKAAATLLDKTGGLSATGMIHIEFDFASLFDGDTASADAIWKYAADHVAYPGALSEIGRACFIGRKLDEATTTKLDGQFRELILSPLKKDLQDRKIDVSKAAHDARFDTGAFVSAFAFLWSYSPSLAKWRGDVHEAAGLTDAGQREERRQALEANLATLLSASPTAVGKPSSPAELNGLLSMAPGQGGTQPTVMLALRRGDTVIKDPETQAAQKAEIATSAEVSVRWEVRRTIGRQDSFETLVFAGTDPLPTPEGPKVDITDNEPVKPDQGKPQVETEGGSKPDAPGKTAKSGKGAQGTKVSGGRGSQDGGEGVSFHPPPVPPTTGLAPTSTVIMWSEDGKDGEAKLADCAPGMCIASVTDVGAGGQVWPALAAAKEIEATEFIEFSLSNGRKLKVGKVQGIFVRTGENKYEARAAQDVKDGDMLLSHAPGTAVTVTGQEHIKEKTRLLAPMMVIYPNMFAEGVLVQISALMSPGGLARGTKIEVPGQGGGNAVPIETLKKNSPVQAFQDDGPPAGHPTRLVAVEDARAGALVALHYTIGGTARILRIGATQKVVVWLPEERKQTYACVLPEAADPRADAAENENARAAAEERKASPEVILAKEPERKPPADNAPPAGEKEIQGTQLLEPGMLLVTGCSGGKDEPFCVTLNAITTELGLDKKEAKAAAAEEAKHQNQATGSSPGETVAVAEEKGNFEVFYPEAWNFGLLRAEGVMVKCLTKWENTQGVYRDHLVTRPPRSVAPGAPMTDADLVGLEGTRIDAFGAKDEAFLTISKWPEKNWYTDRTVDGKTAGALRRVRIATASGSVVCGNWQLLKAVHRKPGSDPVTESVHAERITYAPEEWSLLFLDRKGDNPGVLKEVPVTKAAFEFDLVRHEFRTLVGNGKAGFETVPVDANTSMEIYHDLFFANGFLIENIHTKTIGGGGDVTGGGGQMGVPSPDGSIAKVNRHVKFNLPGLEGKTAETVEDKVGFTGAEMSVFNERLTQLDAAWNGIGWTSCKPCDPARLARFLSLYFAPPPGQKVIDEAAMKEIIAQYCTATADGPPPWTAAANQTYLDTRSMFLTHGAPADLYLMSFHFIFLSTLAYELELDDWGDALVADYLVLAMNLALADNPEQPDRAKYYLDDDRYRVQTAVLWARDVIHHVRNGRELSQLNVTPVTVTPAGWKQALLKKLPLLTPEGGSGSVVNGEDVNLGNLWLQIRKMRASEDDETSLYASEPLIAWSPGDKAPEQAFPQFGTCLYPPFEGRTLRQVLGIRSRTGYRESDSK